MNLAAHLKNTAATRPSETALFFGDETLTYSQLDREVDRVATGLHKIGIRKGDRVAFSLGNEPVFVSIYFGILRAGAVAAPLNTSFTAAELRPYLSSIAPRAIVAGETSVNEIMSAGPHSAPVFVVGRHSTARPFDQILADGEPPRVEIDDEDLAVIAYTSGTSANPKGAMLSHGNLNANLDQMLQIPQAKTEPGDVVLGVLPLFHIFGLNVVLAFSIRQGASVCLVRRFDPEETLKLIVQRGVTIIVGAPPMFISWLGISDGKRLDLQGVRFAISGASALGSDVITRFKERFGVEIWEGYGLTETAPTLTTTRMDSQRAGSVGKPLPGIELRVVDETGADALPGDPGEVWVRGPNVFKGYWQNEDATAAAFNGDWFRTGDLGYRDLDGYLWLIDRRKEVIIVSGFNVYPREIEEAIIDHPAVLDAAVIGVPHPRQGETPKAFVVLKPSGSVTDDELLVFCTKKLARFKVPSSFEFVRELPRLQSGKVLKRALRPSELGDS